MNVLTIDGGCEVFRPRKIFRALVDDTGINEEYARKVTRRVNERVKNLEEMGFEEITTSQIRCLVNSNLIKDGELKFEQDHEIIGVPIADIMNELQNENRSNANVMKSAESVHKYVADLTFKQIFLREMPKSVRDAHVRGDIRLHDAEYGLTRPNCLNHDLRYHFEHGLDISGSLTHSSVSRPAKRLMAALNQALQIAGVAQTLMSGGQGIQLFNAFLAPYTKGMSKDEVYQAIESFIFSANQNYISRGGQTVFLTVGLSLGVPKFLEDVEAILPGGIRNGDTYGGYEDEANLIQRVFTDILKRKDGVGKPFPWPNTIYYMDDKAAKMEDDLLNILDASATIGFPYFANQNTDYVNNFVDYMGCRSALVDNWTGDWEQDCLRTGNLTMTTMNLPRLAYQSSNEGEFFDELLNLMDLVKEGLLARKDLIMRALYDWKLAPFLMQEKQGDRYYKHENATISFGFVGLNEAVKYMTGYELHEPEGNKLAHEILDAMNCQVKKYKAEDNLRYSIIATPAESTASAFCQSDLKKFPKQTIYNGTKADAYYTNSSHVRVDANVDIGEKVSVESKFFPKTLGGQIGHLFLQEQPDLESLLKFNNKVLQTDMGFYAYTRDFSYCLRCQTVTPGLINQCVCGEKDEIEQFSRITGYYSKVGHAKSATSGWSDSKRRELGDRRRYNV